MSLSVCCLGNRAVETVWETGSSNLSEPFHPITTSIPALNDLQLIVLPVVWCGRVASRVFKHLNVGP